MIDKIVDDLVLRFKGALCTNRPFSSLPNDIDIFFPALAKEDVLNYLQDVGFSCLETKNKIQARKFIEGKIFFIDAIFSVNYLKDFFPCVSFAKRADEVILQNVDLEKFFKYIFTFNNQDKAINFIQKEYYRYRNFLFDCSFFNKIIFKDDVELNSIISLLKGNKFYLFRVFKIAPILHYFFHKIISLFLRYQKGLIVSVVGADGSGKSTIVKYLSEAFFAKTIYMGDWGYFLQPFYNFLHRKHIFISRLSYPFMFFENWIRYFYIFILKISGYIVITDRYPGFNRHLRRSNFWLSLNNFIYYFFPKADKYIFVSAPPHLVYSRKQELSKEEIDELQNNMRKYFRDKNNFIEINNIDINKTINKAILFVSISLD